MWKYIMLEIGGKRYPVIFPAFLKHKDVALGLSANVFGVSKVASAGLVDQVEVHDVHGESTMLGLKSLPEDEVLMDQVNRG